MSAIYNENSAHRAAIAAAEGTKQTAISAAGNNQASVNAATLAYARTCLKSAVANGCDTAPWTWLMKAVAGVQA
jgi:hypothetical protein